MGNFVRQCLVVCVVFFAVFQNGNADWVNLTGADKASTIAEIYIENSQVRVKLEVEASEFKRLESIAAGDVQRRPKGIFAGLIHLRADDRILNPRMEIHELRKRQSRRVQQHNVGVPPESTSAATDLKRPTVHYAELVYPLDHTPARLLLSPATDRDGSSLNEIGLILFHDQLPVIDYQFLKKPEVLILNWKDPWYSHFENSKMKRHQQAGVMAYLYIEPNEVRQEIMVRVADLSAWMDIGLDGKEFIEGQARGALKKKVARFLLDRNSLTIDSKQMRPILDRVEYLTIEPTGLKQADEDSPLGAKNTIVGVIIAYITEQLPQKVELNWGLFSDAVNQVPITAYDLAGQYDSYVTRENPIFEWENYFDDYEFLNAERNSAISEVDVGSQQGRIEIPILSLLATLLLLVALIYLAFFRRKGRGIYAQLSLVLLSSVIAVTTLPDLHYSIATGKPQEALSEEEAASVLVQLLKNVYRAFDFRTEEDVYDKLAVSVSGDLLEKIYLQNRQVVEAQKAGGARAKVKRVEVTKANVAPDTGNSDSNSMEAEWTTFGTVAHWGHVHTRKNLYHASLTITPINGRWKITGFELLEGKRIDQN